MGHDHDSARICWAFSRMTLLVTARHSAKLQSFGLELEVELELELKLELETNLELQL